MSPHRRRRADIHRLAIALYTAAALATMIVAFGHSLGWIGRTFPGFFVMKNRVVPSVGLSHWTGIVAGKEHRESIYQHQVVIVDDAEAATAEQVYEQVAAKPAGTVFRYMLRHADHLEPWNIASMQFAMSDYLSVFGAYLLNALIFTGVGIVVWVLGPRAPTTTGTIVLALDLGAFCLTAMDLYGPSQLFRLHVTTEALFPAVLLHLTLVFPVVRMGGYRRTVLAAIYLADAVLIAVYQLTLYDPAVYSRVHNFCMAVAGLGGVVLIGSCIHAYSTSPSLLVRRRIGIVLLGTLAGFAIPAWLLTMSGLYGGARSISVAAFTAPLFPLSLAYAVVKLDLFEIDAMLRRGLSYLLLTGTVVAIYGALIFGFGLVVQTTNPAYSALVPLVFSLLMVSLFNPMRDRVQHLVDRLYYRTSYNAQKTLERASGALVSTLNLDDLSALAVETMCSALLIDESSLWLRSDRGDFELAIFHGSHDAPNAIAPDHPLIERLRSGRRAVTVYDFDEDGHLERPADVACQEMLARLHAQVVLALAVRGELIGVIALGRKKSGTIFTLDDLDFLSTFTNQVAVAIVNAQSYRKIEELNTSLEHKVAQRTSELAQTNDELAQSLGDLERAYNDLQRSQENLLRAEKMAALGRLTAGIAHEVNTPLGASLNSLKMMEELVGEYRSSIGDPSVDESDHREIAGELEQMVGNVFKWTTKAAGYIRSIKAHTRGADSTDERSFEVGQLIEDTRLLLAHRLRLSAVSVTVECPRGVMLYGDPGRLGQVLTNLLTNAIDAYDGHGTAAGIVRVIVTAEPEHVEIAVEDEGSGIEPEHLSRVFEELFTTKPAGKGTGLGLPISRDIMSDCFGGRIDVASEPGKGSRFTLWIPRRKQPSETGGERRAAAQA